MQTHPRPAAALLQTMYRIKDPKRSLDFYSKVCGLHRGVAVCMTFCEREAIFLRA